MPPRYRRPVGPAERARREQATADKLTALHDQLADQVAAAQRAGLAALARRRPALPQLLNWR